VECSDGHGSTAAIAAAFVFGRRPMSRCVARHAIRARVDAGVCVHTLQQVLCGGNGWGGCHALGLCGGGWREQPCVKLPAQCVLEHTCIKS
jgi:hypothetical protein